MQSLEASVGEMDRRQFMKALAAAMAAGGAAILSAAIVNSDDSNDSDEGPQLTPTGN